MFKNITIVGGSGHIGLPLALLFAKNEINVNIYDKNIINNNCFGLILNINKSPYK